MLQPFARWRAVLPAWPEKAEDIVVPCAVRAAGIKLLGVPQPEPMHRFFFTKFSGYPQEDLEMKRFWGYPPTTVAIATL